MAASTDTVEKTIDNHQEKNNVEDGNFWVYTPLSDTKIKELNTKGFQVEEQNFIDMPLTCVPDCIRKLFSIISQNINSITDQVRFQ